MPAPWGRPIVDHHCHLSPSGEGVAAARRFRAAGGTHLFLATQAYEHRPPLTLAAYREQFETTGRLADAVRREAGVSVQVVLAPFPVDIVDQLRELGEGATMELQRAALDLAARWVRDRKAIALGEVGWPHFEVPPEVDRVARAAFRLALESARDVDCPVVVHSPDLDAAGFQALAEEARSVGLPPSRVVKHYARAPVPASERGGTAASYVATRALVDGALGQDPPWFLETDFLDDPRRPGAVLDLATVPRRVRALLERGEAAAERLRIPFETSVEAVYGIRPEVP